MVYILELKTSQTSAIKVLTDTLNSLLTDVNFVFYPNIIENESDESDVEVNESKPKKVGGIIIIDDAMHQGVGKCLRYIDSNYKHYKKIQSPNTVGAYQKMSSDKRDWDYHTNF